ncbi:uncharacterized protein LOC135704897 [Ochlerotatus camptorhynchus]|uniref:uncharacterized protein LOC135704897 n=1 Tax=Ochlerotatus camptorhynchus TaxID=644619 RepID=UPI0031CFFC70
MMLKMNLDFLRTCLFATIVLLMDYKCIESCQAYEFHDNSNNGYSYLRDLPLPKLLKLQKSVCDISNSFISLQNGSLSTIEKRKGFVQFSTEQDDHQLATALPLTDGFSRRGAVEAWDTKPSKIQSIFQISVTALAFLAFASYLLCMIVQAIKSKGTTYFHPTVTSSATLSSAVKKRRPLGRKRRHIENGNITITENNISAGSNPELIYASLIVVSEAYVKFSAIDK